MPPKNPMTEGEALAVLRELVLRVLASHTTEMEGYSYFSSNPGVPKDSYNEVADEIAAAIAALTAASGGEVVGYIVHSADELTRFEATQEAICLGIGRHAVYTAPPAAVPADALEWLVEKWWRDSVNERDYYADALRACADALAALIPKGADHA